jgi:hypothetical protein
VKAFCKNTVTLSYTLKLDTKDNSFAGFALNAIGQVLQLP